MTVSEDGLTYLFMIREDARWSDGEPVTADDFVFACGAPARRARSRPSCSTTSRTPRRSTTGRCSCACARRATTSPTCSPRTGPIRGRATAPRADGVDWRDPASLVGNGPLVLGSWARTARCSGRTRTGTPTVGQRRRGAHHVPRRNDEADLDEWRAGRHDVAAGAGAARHGRAGHGRRRGAADLDHLPRPSGRQRAARRRPRVRLAIAHAIDRDALLAATWGIDVAGGPRRADPAGHAGTRCDGGARLRPGAGAGAARRGRLPGRRRAAGARVSAPPWRPGDTLVEQLAAVGIPARVARAGEALGVHAARLPRLALVLARRLPGSRRLLPRPAAHRAVLRATTETDALLRAARASQPPRRAHAPVPRVRAPLDRRSARPWCRCPTSASSVLRRPSVQA